MAGQTGATSLHRKVRLGFIGVVVWRTVIRWAVFRPIGIRRTSPEMPQNR